MLTAADIELLICTSQWEHVSKEKAEEIEMINSTQFNNLSRITDCAELELHLYWDNNPVIVDILSETLNTVSLRHILFFKRHLQQSHVCCV
jgi:hypothetical protein